jgi:hypothetical protein
MGKDMRKIGWTLNCVVECYRWNNFLVPAELQCIESHWICGRPDRGGQYNGIVDFNPKPLYIKIT